jgi:hypothetical protein
MNTLLRVGDKVVNTATVTHIKLNDSGGAVSIEFVGGTGLKVRGKDAAQLRAWLTDPDCVENGRWMPAVNGKEVWIRNSVDEQTPPRAGAGYPPERAPAH